MLKENLEISERRPLRRQILSRAFLSGFILIIIAFEKEFRSLVNYLLMWGGRKDWAERRERKGK
jgi:hypothetical protein